MNFEFTVVYLIFCILVYTLMTMKDMQKPADKIGIVISGSMAIISWFALAATVYVKLS